MTRQTYFSYKIITKVIFAFMFVQLAIGCGQQDIEEILPSRVGVSSQMIWSQQSEETFAYGDLESSVEMTLSWEAFNTSVEISEVLFYIKWSEQISDSSKTEIIEHGAENVFGEMAGKPLARISQKISSDEGFLEVAITQGMIFEVFQEKTIDYGQGTAQVFEQNGRSEAFPFQKGDQFELTWELIDQNGASYRSWSATICDGANSNCLFSWELNCYSDLAGQYAFVVNGQSSYLTSDLGKDSDDFSYEGEIELVDLGDGMYRLPDLSGSFEPEIWGNPPVLVEIVENCGIITLEESSFDYLYPYSIKDGSFVDENGHIIISWCNLYEECGVLELIPL